MPQNEPKTSSFQYFVVFAFLAFTTGIWYYLYAQTVLNIDIAWLLQCLERFIAGGTYTKDFFETNPPLSFLVYLPAYPLYHFGGVSIHLSIFITFAMYIMVANILALYALKKIGLAHHLCLALFSGLILAETWGAGISFGQRDHLVFIFMIPYVVSLICITYKVKISTLPRILMVILGAVSIAIKPHYIIVIACFFLHRLYINRSIKETFITFDCLGFIACGLAYIGFIYAAAPDYIHFILPEAANLYTEESPFPIMIRAHYLFIALIALIPALMVENKHNKALALCSIGLSFICFLPYFLQDKGFHYHILPTLIFGILALYIATYGVMKEKIIDMSVSILTPSILLVLISASMTTGGSNRILSNSEFRNTQYVSAIEKNAWNGVYTSIDFKTMLSPLPYITNLKYGSRFQMLWPLQNLTQQRSAANDVQEKERLSKKINDYIDLVNEDIIKNQPSVITIPQYKDPQSREYNKNFLNFLLKHKELSATLASYSYKDTVEFDISLKSDKQTDIEKLILYDIYVLNKK